jgi:hypothetical protein
MESLATRSRTTLLPFTICAAMTAAFAVLLRPMNSGVSKFPLGTNDPQSDAEVFEMLYTDVIMRHTSGYAYGMVVALILGALLARFGRAAICGTLLGIVNAGVAFVVGGSTVVSMSPDRNGTVSGSLRLDLLSDDGFWMAVLGGAAAFPIWAVAGAALGRLARSGTALLVGGCVLQASICAGFLVGNGTGAPGTFVAILLWPPAGSTAFLTKIALDDNQALATAAFLGGSLSYAVAGYLLTRRRSAAQRPG